MSVLPPLPTRMVTCERSGCGKLVAADKAWMVGPRGTIGYRWTCSEECAKQMRSDWRTLAKPT